MRRRLHVELLKPSHYDDEGYVIQWRRAGVPSNSLASLYAIVRDAGRRGLLGADVDITLDAWDECNTVLEPRTIARRIAGADRKLVCLVGVQSNQFPRAMDLARQFLALGLKVAIGGFHVSGCLSMLPALPPDLQEALDLGITLYAGEAEGHIDDLLRDAWAGTLKPLYNYLSDLPGLEGAPGTFLPPERLTRYSPPIGSFDSGRGCPFQCSFCTIINVQGRKSRYRSADDIEALLNDHLDKGVFRFFITDDDFARNRNWEGILDRIIELRGRGHYMRFIIQVDALAWRIPNFIEKCARAGVKRVFIGLENVNPANLLAAKKRQNKVAEYRAMLQAWRNAGIMTFCGYILGFPADTPESIARDIAMIQRELPLDILEFFILTPLPGSEDHKTLAQRGVPMDPDMNRYDTEHATTAHPTMTPAELVDVYRRAWKLFYTPAHVETVMRRAAASGLDCRPLLMNLLQFRAFPEIEQVHPLQGGYFRIKHRTQRRPTLPRESAWRFYPRRAGEALASALRWGRLYLEFDRIYRRVMRDPARARYTDAALEGAPPAAARAMQAAE